MFLGLHPGWWLLIVDWTIRLAALWWIPTRSRPAASRSWLLLVGFVPLLGLPLYLLFGHPWLSRERIRRQAEASQVIREEQALQHRLRWSPQPDTASAEIVPLVQRQGDFMPVHGNAVDLLTDYDESLHTLIADIDQAEDRVHLLYYLMFDDAVGEAIVEALQRAAARGVQCRVLLDAVGAKRGLRAYRKRLEDWLARDGILAERVVEVSSYHAILGCLVAGMGVALLPRAVLENYPGADLLAAHPLPGRSGLVNTVALWRRGAAIPAVSALVEQLAGSVDQSLEQAA